VLYPGCQVDCVLILEGPQGVGKTSVYRSLVPVPDWYQDTGIAIGEKDSSDALRGVWIYGLDELDSLRRGDLTRTKNFITSTRDHYRQAYDTRARDFLRQCFFGGTTNEDRYLADRTGNRRFLPVRVGRIDLAALVRDRDQVWAEVAAQVRRGDPWHVDTAELRLLAEAHQAERQQVDPWVGLVETWLATPTELVTDGGYAHRQPFDATQGVTTSDVLIHCLGMRRGELTTQHEMRAGHALRECGLERRRTHNAHGNAEREYRYFPPDPDPADVDR
jgi:predicted P-loop ATPase